MWTQTRIGGEHRVKTKVEMGMMVPQPRDAKGGRDTIRSRKEAWKQIPPHSPQKDQHCCHLDLLASRTLEIVTFCSLSHPVCATWLQQPQENDTRPLCYHGRHGIKRSHSPPHDPEVQWKKSSNPANPSDSLSSPLLPFLMLKRRVLSHVTIFMCSHLISVKHIL